MQEHPNWDNVLKVGQVAPDFALENINGTLLALNKRTENALTVIIFYRGDW